MSNTQKLPARINGKRNPEYHSEYMRNYRKTEDPIKKRNKNREGSRQYREDHKDAWYDYFNPYFKKWYQENKEIHFLRNKTSNIKVGVVKGAKFGYENSCILSNLKAVGWSESLPEDKCLNHKISIYWFVKYNKKIASLIVYDVMNIEVITKEENNSAGKREVTDASIKLASKLESKYPVELKGFTAFLNEHKGEIK